MHGLSSLAAILVSLLVSECSGITPTFTSHGRHAFDAEAKQFFLWLPTCPRCNKEHSHGPACDIISSGTMFRTQRSLHCDGKRWWNPKNVVEFWQETIIEGKVTSHYAWHLDSGELERPEDTVLEWGNKWKNATFIEVWEKDPLYCQRVLQQQQPWVKLPIKAKCQESKRTVHSLRTGYGQEFNQHHSTIRFTSQNMVTEQVA